MADLDLARRLAAHERWRWAPGMAWRRTGPGAQALSAQLGRLSDGVIDMPELGYEPVLDDPATAGCLLAMLVASDPAAGWGVSCGPDVGWRATSCEYDISGDTMGEAVARALLLVWGEP